MANIPPVNTKAKGTFGRLTVPSGTILPPVCLLTGKYNVPLIALKWVRRVKGISVANITYYIDPETKAEIDTAFLARQIQYHRYAFIGLTALFLSGFLFANFVLQNHGFSLKFFAGIIANLLIFSIIGYGMFLFTKWMVTRFSVNNRPYISAHVVSFSFGINPSLVEVLNIKSEILELLDSMEKARPVSSGPSSAVRYRAGP